MVHLATLESMQEKYLEKYHGRFGPTFLVKEIPKTLQQYKNKYDSQKILEKQLRNTAKFVKQNEKLSPKRLKELPKF